MLHTLILNMFEHVLSLSVNMNVSADSMTADQLYHDSSKSTNKKSESRVNSSGMDMNAMVKGSKVLPRMGRSETLLSGFRHRVDSDSTELQTEQVARNQRQRHSKLNMTCIFVM